MSEGLNTNFSINNNMNYMQNYGNFGTNQMFSKNSVNPNSIFSFTSNPMQPVTNNYEDDFMMPDFLKLGNTTDSVQLTNSKGSENQEQTVVEDKDVGSTENPQPQNQKNTENQLRGYSLNNLDKNVALTEYGNSYKKTDAAKNTLAFLGFLAPVVGKLGQLFKGGKVAELFKFKQLVIACPAVALAGYGIGTLIDGFINTQRAKAADNQALAS